MISKNEVTAPQQLTPEVKRKFVAFLMSKYGIAIDVDNELLPVYYIAHCSGLLTEQTVRTACLQIQQFVKNLEANANEFKEETNQSLRQLEPKQVHFSSALQAFWYRFAWPGLHMLIVLGVIIGLGYHYLEIDSQKERSELIIPLIKQSKVIKKDLSPYWNVQVIELLPAKNLNEAKAGKHYVYNEKCNCILVPIQYNRLQ